MYQDYKLPPEVKNSMENARIAMADLNRKWKENYRPGMLEKCYPFEKSFDEVVSEMDRWLARANMYNELAVKVESGTLRFESNGQVVTDCFMSECLRFEVDPIEHYGFKKMIAAAYSDLLGGMYNEN